MSAPVEVEHLTHRWPLPKGPPVVAVSDACLEVKPGEILALLGPNGAGKTTLLQILATLVRPSEGRARVAGHDVVTASREVRKNLGYLSSTSGLPTRLTVRECLDLLTHLHDLPAAAAPRAIDRFQLQDVLERHVEALSTGQRQRLRVAAAALHSPPVLILDEPTAGLDLMATDALLDEVRRLRDDGVALLFSTHVMEEAERVADRVAVLCEGRLLGVGPAPALRQLADLPPAASLAEVFRALVRRGGA